MSTLMLSFSDGQANVTVSGSLVGTGAAAAVLAFTEGTTYDFGRPAAGSTNERTLTLNNNGGVPATSLAVATLTTPFGFAGGSYPGTNGTCGTTLAAGQVCTIAITYEPSAVGVHTDDVEVDYHDGISAQDSDLTLDGEALAPALVTICDGATFNFGIVAVGFSVEHTFTVSNVGGFRPQLPRLRGNAERDPRSDRNGNFQGVLDGFRLARRRWRGAEPRII